MQLPFDARQFFDVFARYNTAVWPAQLALFLAGLVAVLLALRPRAGSDRMIGGILGGLWLWMGAVYHLAFFRRINPAATLFGLLFLAEGLLLLTLGGWRRRLRLVWTPTAAGALGAALLAYAVVLYPVLGYVLGHRFPAAPTFGLPCPTTILTLGLLAWSKPPAPWSVLVIPLLWSVVGASAAMQLQVWEDIGLPVAGGLVLVLALKSARGPTPVGPPRHPR